MSYGKISLVLWLFVFASCLMATFHLVKMNKSSDYFKVGSFLSDAKRYEQSSEFFKKSCYYDEANLASYYKLAYDCLQLKKYDEVAQYYSYILKNSPNYADTHWNIAVMFIVRQDFDKAMMYTENALQKNPFNTLAWKVYFELKGIQKKKSTHSGLAKIGG